MHAQYSRKLDRSNSKCRMKAAKSFVLLLFGSFMMFVVLYVVHVHTPSEAVLSPSPSPSAVVNYIAQRLPRLFAVQAITNLYLEKWQLALLDVPLGAAV